MKNLTKWIATVATAAAMFFSVNVKAQINVESPWHLDFGIEGGIPTGVLHTSPAYSKFEFGGTARLEYGALRFRGCEQLRPWTGYFTDRRLCCADYFCYQ